MSKRVHITGWIGDQRVDLSVDGVELRDFVATAVAHADLSDHIAASTTRQRQKIAAHAYLMADQMVSQRGQGVVETRRAEDARDSTDRKPKRT